MANDISNNSGGSGNEAGQIRELVKQAAEPEGFRFFELNFGEDSSGAPAVWISFILEPTYPTTRSGIATLTRLGRTVKSALFEHQIKRVPYVRFRERQASTG